MIPNNIKSLVEKYCMGLEPTESQENEIMDAVKAAGLSAENRREVVSYMAELMAGPTREQKAAAEAEAARKLAEEQQKQAAEEVRIKNMTPEQKYKEGKELIKGNEYEKGASLIEMASNEGLADASIFLALGLDYGEGGIKRGEGSVKYYLSFINQAEESHKDYPRALYELGLHQESVQSQGSAAIKHFEKAAELGYVKALSKLAFGYAFGRTCFPKDEVKAVNYYKLFAEKGDKSNPDYRVALYNLGQIFFFGKNGQTVDEEKAISYYKASADLGDEDAKKRLKEIYAKREAEVRQVQQVADQKKKQIIILAIVSFVYLFFTVKAIILSHPFWILFWGIIYTITYLLWLPGTFGNLFATAVNYFWLAPLFPLTVTCGYFIIRAIVYDSPFWKWFWIVIFSLAVIFDLIIYKIDNSTHK